MASDTPSVLVLQAGATVLELAPARGGAIAALYDADAAGRIDWLLADPAAPAQPRAPHDGGGMASFPLLPYCNRIRDGRFAFGGHEVQLERNEAGSGHALHGIGWRAAWRVERYAQRDDGAQAMLSLRHEPEPGGSGWPWAFEAVQRFELTPGRLRIDLQLSNLSRERMPAGIGQHPFLPHRPGTRLRVDLDAVWQTDAQVMPTGELARPAWLDDLREGAELAAIAVDNNFVGWRHRADVVWPELARLTMSSSSPSDFFVLYSPAGGARFVIEPVTQCTDWLNLLERHDGSVLGGTVLEPGAHLSAQMLLEFARL
jgi:aldose 1-epimerase